MKIRIIPVVLATLLVGCNQILGESKSIHLSGTSAASKQDESIIEKRLREHTSSLSPTYIFSQSEAQTTIEARGAPSDSDIQFLLTHRGLFEAKPESGSPWFVHSDIIDAQAGIDDQQRTVLKLRLSGDAASRVARLSANGSGTVVSAVLDGETLVTARVSASISDGMLQLTVNKPPSEVMLICTLLKTGPLSFKPVSVRVQAHP